MSLCIIAACQQRGSTRVVFSHDWKITEGDASSENTDKLAFVKHGWPAVFAGELSDIELLGETFWDHLSQIKIAPDNIESELQAARAKFKGAMIDRDLRGRFGLGYDEFMNRGKKSFLPQQHRRIVDQMQRELSNADMLLGGVIKNEAYLFQVQETFAAPIDRFGTIGEGADLASRWLHWRDQNEGTSLTETVLNVYQAQRFGSMAGAVGRVLSIYVLDNRGTLRQLRPSFKKQLEKEYQIAKRQKGVPLSEGSFYEKPIEPIG